MLVLHYDFPSPSAAVAVLRLQRIADDGGHVLFAGFDPLGLAISVPATLDQLEEFERWRGDAAELGLPMVRPRRRPPTLRAHVVAELADEVGLGASWRTACLRAYWTEGIDLHDAAELGSLAGEAGLDPEFVARHLADPGRVATVRSRLAASRQRGIGGVPVLEVDGTFVSPHLDDASLRRLASL